MTRTIKHYLALAALLLVLPGTSTAAILIEEINTNGNGDVFLPVGQCGDEVADRCVIDKEFTSIGPIDIAFSADASGQYVLDELIFNLTSEDWTDFHWSITEEFGDVTFFDIDGNEPFTTIVGLGTNQLDLSGGVLPVDGGFNPILTIEVLNLQGALFILSQTPTIDGEQPIPEPGTWLLMGLGLAGAGYVRRRRRLSV